MDSIKEFRERLERHCNDSAKDKKLCELILIAYEYSPTTSQWKQAIKRLLIELQKSPGLYKSSHPDYLEALNKTWQWFIKNLPNFEPRCSSIEGSLLIWINRYLWYQILTLYGRNSQPFIPLDSVLNTKEPNLITCEGIENYIEKIEQEKKQRFATKLKRYIEKDPEGKLQQCHPQKHPNCNCQSVGKRLLLQQTPDKMTAIAREFNINIQTINSFWKRKGLPLLRAIALELAATQGDEDLDFI